MIDAPIPPPPTPRILDAPPADAHQVTQPLTDADRIVPPSHQGNEKELAPLTYPDSAGAPVPVAPVAVRPAVPGTVAITTPGTVGPGTTTPDAPLQVPPPTVPTIAAVVAPIEPHQPAASSSESPSRGAMRHDPDPLHRPTGGFGPAPSTEYHPLSGTEVREVVLKLLDEIAAQIPDDLRFSHALTYPRLECRVTVDVVTYPPEGAVRITKIAPDPKGQASRAVALAHADECCFVVMAERREQDAAGNPVDPPDKLRDEVGLPRPHKHLVGTGTSRQLVDVESPRSHDVAGNELAPDGTPIIAPLRHAVAGAGSVPRMSPGVPVVPPRPATGGPG